MSDQEIQEEEETNHVFEEELGQDQGQGHNFQRLPPPSPPIWTAIWNPNSAPILKGIPVDFPIPPGPRFMSTIIYWCVDKGSFEIVPWVIPITLFPTHARMAPIGHNFPVPSPPQIVSRNTSPTQEWSEGSCPQPRRKWGKKRSNRSISKSGIRLVDDNHCQLCRSNRQEEDVYLGHLLRDQDGKVTCPVLRNLVCKICGATGDGAHTFKYCPFNPHVPLELRNVNFERARATAARVLGVETVPILDDNDGIIYVAADLLKAEEVSDCVASSSKNGKPVAEECKGSQVTKATQTGPDKDDRSPIGSHYICLHRDAIIQTVDEEEFEHKLQIT